MNRKINGRRFRTIEEIYAAVPDAGCKGLCQDSCGPIGASRQEIRRAKQVGYDLMRPAEKLLTLSTVVGGIPMCPALEKDDGTCAIYAIRPLICRLWGVTDDMPCIYGCEPERMLTRKEARHLLTESVRLGGRVTLAPFEPTVRPKEAP
jgi:Fe-S-cluster containining protein